MDENATPSNEVEERTPRTYVDVTDKHLEDAVKVLAKIIGFIGLSGKISAQNYNNRILLSVNSQDAGRIIGRKGQTLEQIQFLLARMLMKGENDFPRISIDIDGYARQGNETGAREEGRPLDGEGAAKQARPERKERERAPHQQQERRQRPPRSREDGQGREYISDEREKTLIQQAQDYAKEVMKWGEPITLPPMNSMERRIIHVALQDNTDVKTESIGEGSRKSIVISQR